MKAIMYHYVQEYNPKLPYLKFLDFKNFKKQLDYFESNYGFVSKEEWLNYISEGRLPEKKGKILLTFDDGLKCHYDYVLPELNRRGLWGFFFICSLPFSDNKILTVHKIHQITAKYSPTKLLREALKLINKDMIIENRVKEFENYTYSLQNNINSLKYFKQLFNYFIDHKSSTKIIDKPCENFACHFKPMEIYASVSEIKKLLAHDNFVGSHTTEHKLMSCLTTQEQKNCIKKSFESLTNLKLISDRIYAHPYGGFRSFNNETIKLLNEADVKYSFNVESKEIDTSYFLRKRMHILPRFDCNLFKFGQVS